jgi:two-component system cell cycle sensor histidine kinase/response regulator CckA
MIMLSNIFNVKSIYEDILLFRQKKIVKYLFLILLLIGVILYILGCKYALSESEWYKIIFYTLIFIWCIGATFLIKALEDKQQELKEKLMQAEKFKAIGKLTGKVAHDLNNILSGIATYPEILMMNENVDPKLQQGLEMIKDSGEKASAVVSDLLTIAHSSSAQMEIININFILDRYIRAHDFKKIKDTYKQVEINFHSDPELPNIMGSYIHIEKTIMNLILNAMEEVSKNEGGKILVTTSNSSIDSSIPGYEDIVPGEYVILSIIDNGSGIDEKYLKKMFEPFFAKKEMGKNGTGLGLTIVWNIVQDHNGFINMHSDSTGTKFELLFPAIREEITKKELEY